LDNKTVKITVFTTSGEEHFDYTERTIHKMDIFNFIYNVISAFAFDSIKGLYEGVLRTLKEDKTRANYSLS